jgi:hypothetical protein
MRSRVWWPSVSYYPLSGFVFDNSSYLPFTFNFRNLPRLPSKSQETVKIYGIPDINLKIWLKFWQYWSIVVGLGLFKRVYRNFTGGIFQIWETNLEIDQIIPRTFSLFKSKIIFKVFDVVPIYPKEITFWWGELIQHR